MLGFRGVTAAVFETGDDPALVSDADIVALIEAARKAPEGRARLLLHPGREDSLHEMIIALPHGSCDHPHINFKSGKSFLALAGQFAVMLFSDDGADVRPVILSADQLLPGARITRLRRPVWHTVIPLAGDTVFLETIVGPFEGNQFAPWYPSVDRGKEREVWKVRLHKRAQQVAAQYHGNANAEV
jgi:cupin fold WbuC family metalloprotein